MRPIAYPIMILVCLSAAGCVRRTITSRPGWKSSRTGKLLTIMPNNQKVKESRIIWFWQDDFHKPRTFNGRKSDGTNTNTPPSNTPSQ